MESAARKKQCISPFVVDLVHVSASFQQKSDKSETSFVIHFEIFEEMV